MARIAITEQDLRAAMRDRRYWQSGHPEREAYQARVTEGWRALAAAGWWDEGGKACTQVFVRAYERTRNGRREHVDAYTQCRPTGRGEGETRIAQARPEHDGAATAGATAAPAPRPVVVFVGGMGDAGTRIVREYANRFGGAHSDRETRYFAHDEGARIRRFIEGLPPGTPVSLVGHSWGGDTAASVAAALGATGRRVDTLVTIDPAGRGTSEAFFARVRAGAGCWVNVNAAGDGSLDPPILSPSWAAPTAPGRGIMHTASSTPPFPTANFGA